MTERTASSFLAAFTQRSKNVGVAGGDLPTRVFAAASLIALMTMSLPATGVQFTVFKIAALIGAEIGAIFLMLGLFFSQKTHFAGLILIPVPLFMVWMVGIGLSWLAIAVGLVFLAEGLLNLFTRKCGINKLLGIDSCKM